MLDLRKFMQKTLHDDRAGFMILHVYDPNFTTELRMFSTQNTESDLIPGSVEIEKWQLRHQNSQTEEDTQSPNVFATPFLVVVCWVHHRYVSEANSFNFRIFLPHLKKNFLSYNFF